MDLVQTFLSGGIFIACLGIALIFLRFWNRSRDRFFGFFSLAFLLMAIERIVFGLYDVGDDLRPSVFSIRLLAFLVIIVAIVDKNRKTGHKL